jgi:PKD repeat protein
VDFGVVDVDVGEIGYGNLLVTNLGASPITQASALVSPPFYVGSPVFDLAGNASTNLLVYFWPTNTGFFSNAVVFLSNGGNSTNPVTGSGGSEPVAAFSATPGAGAKPLTVNFTDQSSGTITNRQWNFGDGVTLSTLVTNVTHTFTNTGTFTVTLLVSSSLGYGASTSRQIVVTNPPVNNPVISAISVSGKDVLINFQSKAGKVYRVEYTDRLPASSWSIAADFIPGTGNIVQAVHTGGAGRPSRFYRINQLADSDLTPVAAFIGNPTSGPAPLRVNFVDTSAGFITNRFWDFGDGSTTNTTATTVSHTYTTASTNTVTLTVTGPTGTYTLTRPNYIVATSQLVITAINISGTNVLVSFTSQAGKFYRVEYADALPATNWQTAVDFVPGTGNIVTAVHLGGALRSSRFYRIKWLTDSDVIPAANFSASPTNGQIPLRVTFTDTSTGYITNRFWNFGDGSTTNTTATTVVHTYTATGTNTVTLTVSSPQGTNTLTRPNYIIASAQLIITAINVSGTNIIISFTSEAGKFYRVEYADALPATNWFTAVDFVPGVSGIAQATHLGGAGRPSRFYRVKVLTSSQVAPSANFTANPTNGSAPLIVTFTDTSTGFATNRAWNFGDGSSTNTTSTTTLHAYVAPGTNTVTLTITGPTGADTLTRFNYIVVNSGPSIFRIVSLQKIGSTATIAFQSVSGVNYGLEFAASLIGSNWSAIGSPTGGNGGIVTLTDTGATASTRFYRVRRLP